MAGPVNAVVLPAWFVPALATAAFTVIISLSGVAFTIWNSSSLHEAALISHGKQLDQMRAEAIRTDTKLERNTKEIEYLKGLIVDKIDTLLERDRFRHNR